MAGLAARLLALHELHARGTLSDDEFARAKARVIDEHRVAPPAAAPPPPPPPLSPVVPGIGLALGAASIANGGLAG